ncbi:MAG: hypothetical protein JWR54_1508 [Mucilaginibacter sp.]|nr:hypothetical protein [Mucilaginibacter sp.]
MYASDIISNKFSFVDQNIGWVLNGYKASITNSKRGEIEILIERDCFYPIFF